MGTIVIPEDIRELSRQRALEFRQILSASQPNQVEPGQIWSTHSVLELPDGRRFETHQPRLVVVLDGSGDPFESLGQIAAAPLSLSISMASGLDLIIPQDRSPLGFGFMVEIWNETPVLKRHLRRFLGKLSCEAVEVLQGLYEIQLLDEDIPSEFSGWVGPRIAGEKDPRLAFQESEIEQVAYLARAATAALAVTEEPARIQTISMTPRWVFELSLAIGRLADFLRGPTVAYAAGATGNETTYVISSSEDEAFFTFELLFDRLPPYDVYLIVHQISPKFALRDCVVTVRTSEVELRSDPTELREGIEIRVGQDPDFDPSSVRSTKVEIV